MTRNPAVIFITLTVLAACADGAPTAPVFSEYANAPPAAAVAASPVRPFGGRCDTDITLLAPESGDPPNLLRLLITYECQLKHMGRTTATAQQIVIFTGPTTAIASNVTTYTAANGDQLFASWTGTSTNVGPEIAFSGQETYHGGTGRFAGAFGSAWISGTASFVTNTGQFTSVGTLAY